MAIKVLEYKPNEDIDKIPCSRQLDAIVEEKVFGNRVYWGNEHLGIVGARLHVDEPWTWIVTKNGRYQVVVPQYSFNMEHAWRVVEHLNERGYLLQLEQISSDRWNAKFSLRDEEYIYSANGECAPEAICKAAIKLVCSWGV